jgi:H+/Cl- antiporter ClcA
MKRRLSESLLLFFSVAKWGVLATVIGLLVGGGTALFLKALDRGIASVSKIEFYWLLLPAALFVSSLLVRYFAPAAEGHGTEKVIEAVHKRSGRIAPAVVPIKALATLVTLSFGGSAGKEGPSAQIGAGISSIFADLFRFGSEDRKKLVICGISAGFATVIGTPIAGAIFGVEVLVVGGIMYETLLPSLISGVTAFQFARYLGLNYQMFPKIEIPVFTEPFFLEVAAAGVLFGLCSFLLIDVLNKIHKISRRITWWAPLKGLAGGVLLVLLAAIFSTDYLGLGLDTIHSALSGARIVWYAFLIKIVATSITLSFGGSGGILTPILFIGATAGAAMGHWWGVDSALFASIGMVSVLAGAANAPISASIMAMELFGSSVAPYATVACVISFLMTGHRSVYPSQIVAMKKTPLLNVSLGAEVQHLDSGAETSVRLLRDDILSRYKDLRDFFRRLSGK